MSVYCHFYLTFTKLIVFISNLIFMNRIPYNCLFRTTLFVNENTDKYIKSIRIVSVIIHFHLHFVKNKRKNCKKKRLC